MKIEANQVYKSNGIPPIAAKVSCLESTEAGEKVHLETATGVRITIPAAELKKNWTQVDALPNRYFVSFVRGGRAGRCGVMRGAPIQSIADVEEIERFLTEDAMKNSSAESAEDVATIVTGWQPFEQPLGVVERAIQAVSLVGFILEQDKAGISWWTPTLQQAAEEAVA